MDGIWDAASRLAASMRPYSWYHRTSMCEGAGIAPRLVVWAEYAADVPPEIPATFEGFTVRVNRVDDEHPCPFGSVKPGGGG